MYGIDKSKLPECVKITAQRQAESFMQYDATAYDEPFTITVFGPGWRPSVLVDARAYGREVVGPFMSYPYAMRAAIQAALDLVDPMNERGEDD